MKSSRKPTSPIPVVRYSSSQADAVGPPPPVIHFDADRDQVADPHRDDDRRAAHRRRAALLLVVLRAVLADLLAEALLGEDPDQVGGEQDGHRRARRSPRPGSPSPAASPPRDGSRSSRDQPQRHPLQAGGPGRLDQHHVSLRQLGGAGSATASSTSGTEFGLAAPRPFQMRPEVQGAGPGSRRGATAVRRSRRRAPCDDDQPVDAEPHHQPADLVVRAVGFRRPARPSRRAPPRSAGRGRSWTATAAPPSSSAGWRCRRR